MLLVSFPPYTDCCCNGIMRNRFDVGRVLQRKLRNVRLGTQERNAYHLPKESASVLCGPWRTDRSNWARSDPRSRQKIQARGKLLSSESNQEPCGKTTGYEKRKSLNWVSNAHLSGLLCQSSKSLLFLVHPVPQGQNATIVAL